MANNSRKIEEIDEAAMLQSIYERNNGISSVQVKPQAHAVVPPEMEQQPETPEKPKETARRRRSNVDYGTLFLGRNELKTRSCVYISQKVHATISKIIKVIADRDITVGGYIDSILTEHLETHKDEIIDMYNKALSKNSSNNLIDF